MPEIVPCSRTSSTLNHSAATACASDSRMGSRGPLAWPNGADIDPDVLCAIATGAEPPFLAAGGE